MNVLGSLPRLAGIRFWLLSLSFLLVSLLLSAARTEETMNRVGLVEKVEIGNVQLGMMIPYFGTELPKGYRWADGTSEWPEADWVIPELRGKKIPNLNGLLMLGTNQKKLVGTPTMNPKIDFAENFKMPKPATEKKIHNSGAKPDFGAVEEFAIGDRDKGKNPAHWYGPQMNAFKIVDGNYYSFSGDEIIASEMKLSTDNFLPPSMYCRWIIRIE